MPLADQGQAAARRILGLVYANGHGVAQNQAEVAKWYRLASEQGDTRRLPKLRSEHAAPGQGPTPVLCRE